MQDLKNDYTANLQEIDPLFSTLVCNILDAGKYLDANFDSIEVTE